MKKKASPTQRESNIIASVEKEMDEPRLAESVRREQADRADVPQPERKATPH